MSGRAFDSAEEKCWVLLDRRNTLLHRERDPNQLHGLFYPDFRLFCYVIDFTLY